MKAFLDELRRRGVTRAAAVYAVAAWAVIETSATILPALHLPDWTVTLVVVIALIGFPIALVVAWVFDLTRAGVIRTPGRESLPATQTGAQARGRAVELVVIAVLLGLVGWLGWERLQRPAETAETTQEAGRLDSIAVLPFVNLSGDPSNEYFGDGLAEELLNVLVRIEGLRVTARTSSFQYKGRNLDIREIARDLGVATVLEGSVRRAGERVRITAQLIRATDGFHLWSETFDRELADIFAVQDEISQAIANALQSTLQPTSGGGERRHTSNIAAYEAYLRGRFAMNQRTGPTLERAVEEFRQAIALDPDYAAAYSGLSDSYLLQSDYARLSNAESIRLAEPLARRAIELDPGLAEAHASMGLLLRDQGDKLGSID
ncbi:MAG: tetratricopeptide repeat protein, partial [Xanthomonadales bacterium]|nr:tetratricopeptide repeat protein [Xanthomonadales bacterium]